MTERINGDFIKAYETLDKTLSADFGGIAGYLLKAETVYRYQKEGFPEFDGDINALRKMQTIYFSLLETKNVKKPIASEDNIDYLFDFSRRLDEERDPLSLLKTAPSRNNADARKYLPIETEAREVSRKVINRKKQIALASLAAAIVTVASAIAVWRKRSN